MSESPCFQRSEISLAIVGSGGAGVITTGELLFTAAATCGLHGVMTKSYGPQIRGGESACFVRLGDRQFEKQSDEIDLMVVMDWGNVDRFKEELYLSPEAWILYENAEGDVRPEFLQAKNNIPVGWKELASKIVGGKGRANICALGVLCYLLGIKEMAGLRSIEERFGAMEKAGLDENTRSFHAGQDWARQEWKMRPFQLSIEDGVSNRWALTGNQGIVLGSLVAGCDFYAGYPITPATTIMEDLGHYLPLRGGVMIQAEDELAAINMAIGASFGGKKAEYYGGMVFSGGRVTCPVDDPTPLADADVSLDELPVEYYAQNEEGIYLIVGGKIAEKGPGAGCDGPISKIARDTRIKGRAEHTLTLIDFKAGFEDSARGVLTSLDWAIEVVDPTTAAMQMAVNLKEWSSKSEPGSLLRRGIWTGHSPSLPKGSLERLASRVSWWS